MNILIVNDDGIESPWLALLAKAASHFGRVFVSAPLHEQSAKSHSITVKGPIEIKTFEPFLGAVKTIAVNGTPADSVRAGLKVFEEEMDLVISGINFGANLALDVLYSGTLAAAVEAAVNHIPALAFSAPNILDLPYLYDETVKLLDEIIENKVYLNTDVLNINFPHPQFKKALGVRMTKQGKRIQHLEYMKTDHPEMYKFAYSQINFKEDEDSDMAAYNEGYISITPIRIDRTDYQKLNSIWKQNK